MKEGTSFSGGEIRMGEETRSVSNAVYGTEVWNRDPLPPPAPPRVYNYKLTVRHPETPMDPNTKTACAEAPSFEVLIDFEMKMRALGYEFIKLERLED